MQSTALQIAEALLEVEAIRLRPHQPFKWSSGWNSPIYCDNRVTLSYPKVRDLIKNNLKEAILSHFNQVECIAGVATAGIPQGALIADSLQLPLVYVRPKPKEHGMENLIEGKVVKGQKVVVVEDLVSTGGSSLKSAQFLKEAGFEVLGMVAIFTYGFPLAYENFKKAGIPLVTLTNYETLIELCKAKQLFTEIELNSLARWRQSPETWNV